MLSFLKNHPFAVEAFFDFSAVLTFAIPVEDARRLIPNCLEPDTFEDKWSFIAAAMVQTKDLRPKGFPKLFGNDFFLVGYRIFVRFTTAAGKNLRGLYILRSETDKKKMEFWGNIFTHYQYRTTDILSVISGDRIEISSVKSGFNVSLETGDKDNTSLPNGSPFSSWKEARRFAGPLPFTFTYNEKTKKMLIIEGVRENWEPKPVTVISQNFSFIESLGLTDIRLANAFIIHRIPYYWKKGRIERWKK